MYPLYFNKFGNLYKSQTWHWDVRVWNKTEEGGFLHAVTLAVLLSMAQCSDYGWNISHIAKIQWQITGHLLLLRNHTNKYNNSLEVKILEVIHLGQNPSWVAKIRPSHSKRKIDICYKVHICFSFKMLRLSFMLLPLSSWGSFSLFLDLCVFTTKQEKKSQFYAIFHKIYLRSYSSIADESLSRCTYFFHCVEQESIKLVGM